MRPSATRHCVLTFASGCLLAGVMAPSPVQAAFTEQGATWLGGANYTGRSASLADIDNDGDLDLMFQGATGAQQLFRNNVIGTGAFTFTNITSTALVNHGLGDSWSAAWGDYNGDGKIDVFVGQTNSGSATGDVLRNDTTTTGGITTISFSNQSTATGLNDPGFHQNVAWVDINNDRRLDLVIGMERPEKHEIYLQNANGQFTKVGAAVGFQAPVGTKGYGMAIGDYDGDGDLDVYISTCRGDNNIRNNFYKNMLKETGTLSFVDVADTNGTQLMYNTYGTEFLDFDNDGDLDLYVIGAEGTSGSGLPQPTKIFRNDGNGQFTDVDTITGRLLFGGIGTDPNGGKAIDYDNDGDLDLFFHDNLSSVSNVRLFRNDSTPTDPWRFTDVTVAEGITNTGAGGYDGTWGDIDLDGDLDLINPNNSTLSGTPTPERVYINNASTNGNHWLFVDLVGPSWNTSGIGSSLYATMADGSLAGVTLRREANTNAGTFNQSDVPVHFGLGTSTAVQWLRIVWPDGTVQFLPNVAADQYLTVSYAAAMPGDFDGDHKVDTNDFVLWRKYYGAPFTMDDYHTWRSQFGQSMGGGAGSSLGGDAVPEPNVVSLILTFVIAFVFRTRR